MRKLLLFILLLPIMANAQASSHTAFRVRFGAALPATCSPNTGDVFFKTTATIGVYQCLSANTWTAIGGGTIAGTLNTLQKGNGSGGTSDSLTTDDGTTTTIGTNVVLGSAKSLTINNGAGIDIFFQNSGSTHGRITRDSSTGGLTFQADLGDAIIDSGGSAGNIVLFTAAASKNIFLLPTTGVNIGTGSTSAAAVVNATISSAGKLTKYNGIATAGLGNIVPYGATLQKAETGTADTNVLTYTPPAAAGTYRACVAISVTSATAGIISWTASYTDSSGNAQANIAMPLFQLGTAAPNTTFTTSVAGNYSGCALIDVNNAAAPIVIKWVGGGTTVAKMSSWVEQGQ